MLEQIKGCSLLHQAAVQLASTPVILQLIESAPRSTHMKTHPLGVLFNWRGIIQLMEECFQLRGTFATEGVHTWPQVMGSDHIDMVTVMYFMKAYELWLEYSPSILKSEVKNLAWCILRTNGLAHFKIHNISDTSRYILDLEIFSLGVCWIIQSWCKSCLLTKSI
jgi:hypothetical protein